MTTRRRAAIAGPDAVLSAAGREQFTAPIDTEPSGRRPAHIVVAPCVIVRGERGSVGTFYSGHPVTSWECADGQDNATPAELDRLIALGVIKAA